MSKASGLGDQLFIDGYDLSGDTQAVGSISSPSAPLDVTGINKSAHERIYGLLDGEISFDHYFNDAASADFPVLKTKPSTDRIGCYFHGSAIGNMAAALVAKQVNFDWNRNADGSLMGKTQLLGNGYALDYCEQLTAGKRTDTAATNGSSLNAGAASANGAAAYLQVFSFSGTDATVKVQSSSDNGAGDAFADILTFTQVTAAPTMERKALSTLTTAVEQYLRAVTVTTGGFTSMVFAVCLTRYPAAL